MDKKQFARQLFLRTMDALKVSESISRCVSRTGQVLRCGDAQYDLSRASDIRVVAVGKAAHPMLAGLVAILPAGTRINGIVSAPAAAKERISGVRYFEAGHPHPSSQSLLAGEAALNLLHGCTEHTVVMVLLSGGGSALMEFPLLPELSLHEVQQLNQALVNCGAPITNVNAVRKHVSAVKGGRLAAAAVPARVLTLAISDVPVGSESALASGPTLPDPTTREDVLQILAKYELGSKVPPRLLNWIECGEMPETPKPGNPAFARAHFQVVLGMHELFHTAHRIAESLDCEAFCDNSTDDWPVEKAADFLLSQLQQLRLANPRRPVVLIADGELSSPVAGGGVGGRNSAFVLASAQKIAGTGMVVLSAGTDGFDGNSPAAGAVADGETFSRAQAAGLDPQAFFACSDSFTFFEALGDAIITGPTGNNLRDLRLLLAFP